MKLGGASLLFAMLMVPTWAESSWHPQLEEAAQKFKDRRAQGKRELEAKVFDQSTGYWAAPMMMGSVVVSTWGERTKNRRAQLAGFAGTLVSGGGLSMYLYNGAQVEEAKHTYRRELLDVHFTGAQSTAGVLSAVMQTEAGAGENLPAFEVAGRLRSNLQHIDQNILAAIVVDDERAEVISKACDDLYIFASAEASKLPEADDPAWLEIFRQRYRLDKKAFFERCFKKMTEAFGAP